MADPNRTSGLPISSLAFLIRLLATLSINLHPMDGLTRRVARCIAEDLGDLMESGDHYVLMFRETLSSATGRLCLGGNNGPSLLDASAALYELAQTIYSIPQAPPLTYTQIQQNSLIDRSGPYSSQQQQQQSTSSFQSQQGSHHYPPESYSTSYPPEPPPPTRGYPSSSNNNKKNDSYRGSNNNPQHQQSPPPSSITKPSPSPKSSSKSNRNSQSSKSTFYSTKDSSLLPTSLNKPKPAYGRSIPRPTSTTAERTAAVASALNSPPPDISSGMQASSSNSGMSKELVRGSSTRVTAEGKLNATEAATANSIARAASLAKPVTPLSYLTPASDYVPRKSSNGKKGSSTVSRSSGRNSVPPARSSSTTTTTTSSSSNSSSSSKDSLSGLPIDVLTLVVDYSQPPTYSNRLAHNLALSLVCKNLDKITRKRLREEIHITKASQLIRLDELISTEPERMSQVVFLTIELNIEELRWKRDQPWYGQNFQSVMNHLSKSVERVSIALKDTGLTSVNRVVALEEATRGTKPIYEQFEKAKEMRLYFELTDQDLRQLMKNPGKELRVLYVDSVKKPVVGEKVSEIELAVHPWTVLSLPGVILSPDKIVQSLSTTSGTTLQHLDCSLRLPLTTEELRDYLEFFDQLAPTLIYLALQFSGTPSISLTAIDTAEYSAISSSPRIWTNLCRYLTKCLHLESLTLSILYLDTNYNTLTLLSAVGTLPKLQTLKLLSFIERDRTPVDLSEELIKVLAKAGARVSEKETDEEMEVEGDERKEEEVGETFPELRELGVLLPKGRDRITWEVLELACTLKEVALVIIG